eukprot:1177509-Rhodomonas_salina.2
MKAPAEREGPDTSASLPAPHACSAAVAVCTPTPVSQLDLCSYKRQCDSHKNQHCSHKRQQTCALLAVVVVELPVGVFEFFERCLPPYHLPSQYRAPQHHTFFSYRIRRRVTAQRTLVLDIA